MSLFGATSTDATSTDTTAGDTTTSGGTTTTSDLRSSISVWRIVLYVILVLLVVFFLIPIEAGIVTSFKTADSVIATAPYVPPGPGGFTLQHWADAFDALSGGLINSLLLAIPSAVLSAVFGSIAAYGLTQTNWRGQIPVLMLFVAGVFIPYQAVLVPLSRLWSNYLPLRDLLGAVWGLPGLNAHYAPILALIVTDIAYGIPICTVLFRGYYLGISEEMVEAAKLDGASVSRIYRRVVLPLSGPMFAVTIIFQFTQIWNDLLFPLILVSSGSSPSAPVTLQLVGLGVGMTGIHFGLRMAGAILTAIPTLLVFILFGEQFAQGVAGRQ